MELIQESKASSPNGKVNRRPAALPGWTLVRADADAIKVLWPSFIRPGLLRIKQKDKHSGQWLPEHVRAAIDGGHLGRLFCECHLIVPTAGTQPVGFVILRLYNDEFVQVPLTLFVWITYCTEPRAMRDVLRLIEKRAKEIGVRYVEGLTSRTAWLRRLRKFGYSAHQIIIRKEIA